MPIDYSALPVFSERNARHRVRMRDLIIQLAIEHNAEWKLLSSDLYPNAERIALVAPGGLEVTVRFDKDSWQPNVYVLSWHMHIDSPNRLNNATFGGNVNPHHKLKATYVAQGFVDLCQKLSKGLKMAASGDAYLPLLAQSV